MCHDNVEETAMHLFFECTSSVARWFVLGWQWSVQGSLFQMLKQQNRHVQSAFFMEIMVAAWCLWKERNDYVFNNKVPSVQAWKRRFASEVKLHLCRIREDLHVQIMNWLNSL